MSYSTYKTLYELVDPVIVEQFLKKQKPTTFPEDVWNSSKLILKKGTPILCNQFFDIMALPWMHKGKDGLDPFTYPAAIVLSYYINNMKPVNILHTFLIATILKNKDLEGIHSEIVYKLTDKQGLGGSSWKKWRSIFGKTLRTQTGIRQPGELLEKLYSRLLKSKRITMYDELKSTLLLAAVFNKVPHVDPRVKKQIEKTIEDFEKRI